MNKKVFFSLVTLMLCVVCLWMVVSKGSIKIAEDEVPLANSAQQKSPDEATDSLTDDDVVIEITVDDEKQDANGRVICIDAGHQKKANMKKEPVGPGASKMKAKVDGGTVGTYTGLTEYQLNLDVALKLQTELEKRGYTVIMVRTTNDVNISNSERSEIANAANADAFIRIHADGSDIASVNGASTLCQSAKNPYNGYLYEKSRKLADTVLEGVASNTGCKKRQVIESDSMTGINWSKVPTTIVEVGYLTNKSEEAKLGTAEYQQKIAEGIADGIDSFFAEGENKESNE